MVKFWSLAAMAAFALAATTSVEAQNAAVHAPDLESRAATPAVAPATAPTTAPKARASTSAAATTPKAAAPAPAAATTPKAAATTPKAATTPSAATTPKAATTPTAATTPKAAGTTAKTDATAAASKAPLSSSAAPATNSATWVENKIKANPTQKACYRRVSLASNKQCAKGYAFDNLVSCWSQCPLDYPVQCGFECLPQNKDCALEVATKASAIATTALSVATSGVFGALLKAATGAQKALACGQAILDVTTKISGEVDKLAEGKALTDKEKAKTAISNMDFALYDIPAAIATCLGTTLPANYQSTKKFTKYVEKLIVSAIDMKFENINPIDPKNFVNFYKSFRDFWVKDTTAAADGKLTEVTADDFVKIGQTATTCGGMLKDYIDKVQNTVADYIKKNPTSTADKLDFAVLNLPLILQDLPKATVNCIKSNSADGIKTRDEIITAARLISEQVINLAKSGAKNALKTLDQYKLEIAQFGLDVIAFWDPLQISALVKEFLMPICPLTEYKGVIQRGTADQALGLEMVGKAFEKTYGTWENEGDGQIYFRFESFDTKDVKINVMSGGKKVYEWALGAKKKLKMTGPLTLFAGKTLYIDRWRPGILNFMGTGGGSLLMWVPENTKGSITLEIAVNPTEIGDR